MKISQLHVDHIFHEKAIRLFHHQAKNCPLYHSFLSSLGTDIASIKKIEEIPFLPISFFKTHTIQTGDWEPAAYFQSSGTTQSLRSRHFIKNINTYKSEATNHFEQLAGKLKDKIILAYLPGYTENPHSSLISMLDEWIKRSEHPQSCFVEFSPKILEIKLIEASKFQTPIILMGVAHALVDAAQELNIKIPNLTIIETGGMKLSGKVIGRTELHKILENGFGTSEIISEYGMTELQSQAYSTVGTNFHSNSTLKVFCYDPTDPMCMLPYNRHGVLHIIDLLNEESCAFIATEDLGKVYDDGTFEVHGRISNAEIRGCNLLYWEG